MKNIRITLLAACSVLVVFTNCTKKNTIIDTSFAQVTSPVNTGEFLVAPAGYRNATSGFISIYDKFGNLEKQTDVGSTTMNFRKWILANGTIRYTYLKYDASMYQVPTVGYNVGSVIVLDENFQQINEITLLPYGDHLENNNPALDGHDFVLLADNHYIAMAYYEKTVSNIPAELNPNPNCKVMAPIIQEVENGKVVWEWDGTKLPELYKTSIEGNNFSSATVTQDYAHLNSIIIDPKDNNLVLSFRNLNQVVKIERYTGKILWRLGGTNSDFPVSIDQKFLRQHNAHFLADNKTLLIFDNGDQYERPYTRIVEFGLNEANKIITSNKIMDLPNRSFTQYTGSVEKTDSTYFIDCGSDPRIIEVNFETGAKIFEKKLDLPSYRAYRY